MQAVIMAGGKGTRLSSVTKDLIPKPMVCISGKPVLEYQINCLAENEILDIWIITGHLHDAIEAYFGSGEKWGVTLRYFHEEQPMGTAGALFSLKRELEKEFILLFGDIFFDIDLRQMIRFHQQKAAKATLLVHPNSHPGDSDLIVLNHEAQVTAIKEKGKPRTGYFRNLVNAGIYCVNRTLLENIEPHCPADLEKELILPRIEEKGVYGYFSTEYIRDIGTPNRLRAAAADWEKGIVRARNRKYGQKCIFVDRDGTINQYRGFITEPEELCLEDKVPEGINLAHEKGYLVIVITNQPVIARNLCSIETLEKIHHKMEMALGERGAYVDDIRYCPHHPDSGFPEERKEYKIKCSCRKPEIGLIQEAEAEFHIDLSRSYMVGDTTTDVQTGIHAGLKTILLRTGEAGQDGKYPVTADFCAGNLLEAVQLTV